MYQPLIFACVLRDEACSLASAFDAHRLERSADALVDGVGRNAEPNGDFFRGEMLVHEPQAVELARR